MPCAGGGFDGALLFIDTGTGGCCGAAGLAEEIGAPAGNDTGG